VNQVLPVIAVPTTSGTGSEVTPYSVLMNVETRQKGTIQQQEICPRIAILDPELTKTQPPHLTAATGVDAFVQAVESFISISKFSPVAEWAAKEAIAIVYEALPRVYRNPSDLELRLAMAWASALSGIAISHRGTTAVHAIAEPLGAIAHIPHGDAVAMCALPVLQRTWPKAPERFAALCDLLEPAGHGSGNQLRKAERALELIRELFLKVDMMKKAKDFIGQGKISDALFEDVKKYKFRPLGQHPAQFGDEELLSIVRDIVG
jgi:alcohol dehydrogenase class IV